MANMIGIFVFILRLFVCYTWNLDLRLAFDFLAIGFSLIVGAKIHELGFEGARKWDDHCPGVILVHILLDLGQPESKRENKLSNFSDFFPTSRKKNSFAWFKRRVREGVSGHQFALLWVGHNKIRLINYATHGPFDDSIRLFVQKTNLYFDKFLMHIYEAHVRS